MAMALLVGCQIAPPVSVRSLEMHRQLLDLSDLKPTQRIDDLHVTWALPKQWEALPAKKNVLYCHQQYRSPSHATGVGVAHIQMPLPLPAEAILWFAKNEYLKRAQNQGDGKLIGQWTDSLGRQWFEAENAKYHVKGYAITRGTEAWIIYSGWRTSRPAQPMEIAQAQHSLESIVPTGN